MLFTAGSAKNFSLNTLYEILSGIDSVVLRLIPVGLRSLLAGSIPDGVIRIFY